MKTRPGNTGSHTRGANRCSHNPTVFPFTTTEYERDFFPLKVLKATCDQPVGMVYKVHLANWQIEL